MNALATLSPLVLLSLWSELEQCYYGDNGYGGHTAEIYAYRLMQHSPLLDAMWQSSAVREAHAEAEQNARNALVELCRLFEKQRDVEIYIDGWANVAEWAQNTHFDHHAHVRVVRKREVKP